MSKKLLEFNMKNHLFSEPLCLKNIGKILFQKEITEVYFTF
jgi:hypothetical protein